MRDLSDYLNISPDLLDSVSFLGRFKFLNRELMGGGEGKKIFELKDLVVSLSRVGDVNRHLGVLDAHLACS